MGTGLSSPNLRRKEQDSQPPQEQDQQTESPLLGKPPELSETSRTKPSSETGLKLDAEIKIRNQNQDFGK